MDEPMSSPAAPAGGLIGPGDPPVFSRVNSEGRAPVLLIADHAGNAVPAALGRLGLEEAAFGWHIAYDIGIAPLTRRLAARLDAPAILHGYSRLVIDPNRRLDDPTAICAISDGVVVPGNRGLDAGAAAARAAACHTPYHAAIAAALDGFAARGVAPALISMHSFTPVMRGLARPWHVGVLWNADGRIPLPLLRALAAAGDLCVGDNQPYSGRDAHGYSVDIHGGARGLPHVLIEIRQDLIATPETAVAWADRLADALAPILADPALYAAWGGPA